jgi:DNA-binding transcriptional LysR family regulator
MPDELDWSWCRSFLGVMRRGSFSAAARHLGVAHPTVRRHVLDMERHLGAPLFVRSPAGLEPTDTARAVRPAAEAMEAAAEHLVRAGSAPAEAVAGTVRITASEIMGTEVLPPLLSRLRREHPGLVFELALTDALEDMLRHDADIAIRMVRPTQVDLVAQRVGVVELGLYATQEWIEAHGVPRSLAGLLKSGGLVGYDRGQGLIDALRDAGTGAARADFGFRSDSTLAQLAAVRAGLGAGVVQVPLAAREPTLRRILPAMSRPLEIWLTTHPDVRGVARVKVVVQSLAEALSAYAARRARAAPKWPSA